MSNLGLLVFVIVTIAFYSVTAWCTLQLVFLGHCGIPIWLLTVNWLLILWDIHQAWKKVRGD